MTESAVESLGRVRAKGVLLLTVTFLAGAMAGIAGGRLLPRPFPPRMPPFAGPFGANAARSPLFVGLELSAEQTKRIDSIFTSARPRVDSVMRETQPRIREVLKSVEGAVGLVLTPEQRIKFERRTAGFRNRMGPGPFPGPDSARLP